MFEGKDVVVLDLEIANPVEEVEGGFKNPAGLGLSVGCYYDYVTGRYEFFDRHTLRETMECFIEDQPLLVSFNGIGFDFKVMRALLRREAEQNASAVDRILQSLCDEFKELAAGSYDILGEIWKADPQGKFIKGLNTLDHILMANGLPAKLSNGSHAPMWWQEGRIADVINYCQRDVELTKLLFELICKQRGHMNRDNGPLRISYINKHIEVVDAE